MIPTSRKTMAFILSAVKIIAHVSSLNDQSRYPQPLTDFGNQLDMNYAISDKPMTDEEWVAKHVTEN